MTEKIENVVLYNKRSSKISGLLLPSVQKIVLGLLATIALEVVPFRAYAPFPALLPFYVCTL